MKKKTPKNLLKNDTLHSIEWFTLNKKTVFLDLNKAFDTVNHKMLLNKLDSLGLNNNTMDWFTFYLSDGEQVTSIGNCLSFPRPVTVGVPQ